MLSLADSLRAELTFLWQMQRRAGLEGQMCLYTQAGQIPFRIKQPDISFWFGPGEIDAAVAELELHYNSGRLPNSPLLLNPIVHDASGQPIGSAIAWCTSFSLGVDRLKPQALQRLRWLGVATGLFERGDNPEAGIKAVAVLNKAEMSHDGKIIPACRQLYELVDMASEQYAGSYLLSGVEYLTNNGLFRHEDITGLNLESLQPIPAQSIADAAYCWNAYERHHSLYQKFGTNPKDVAKNIEFFEMVARDIQLFDATGPMRADKAAEFEFIVPGWIPRGAVTVLGATGGTGKSSLAHYLCILAATNWSKDEPAPKWLGQPLAVEQCDGVCVYFSGEDGPQIINARAQLFDPQGRAERLMFQRTDFGENVSFAQHMRRLHKIPKVPIVVIDPARKYLTGDENDAGVVSDFFEAIEEFAIQKNSAMVVVHHLAKGAYPNSAREVLDLLRGSQVFIDRPRVVIGMYRDGPYTIAGLAKNNIPPNLGMVQEERIFARDAEKLQLVWLGPEKGVRNAPLTANEIAQLEQEVQQRGS